MNEDKLIYSVGEYITLLNEQLKQYQAKVQGEVSEVKIWSSGHVYFTLRDKSTNAILDCVIWKGLYQIYGIKMEVGMELLVSGTANIYAPRGKLSFVSSSIELVGEGELKKAYEKLKQKLTNEGIFAIERKRKLPKFPRNIGIITSKQGAVIHDFMNNLSKHGLKITFINTRVEGQESLHDLLLAIRTMKKQNIDTIVVMRGGGSLQSLAAFDSEILVREIVTSPVPVIAAIGHHQDVPLCALAADEMVSTPTAAANLICADWEKGLLTVTNNYQKILLSFTRILNDTSMTLQLSQVKIMDKFNRILSIFDYTRDHLSEYLAKVTGSYYRVTEVLSRHSQHIITHMGDALMEKQTEFNTVQKEKIHRTFSFAIKNLYEQIIAKEKIISLNNPLRQLAMGYSIIRKTEGKVVKSIFDVSKGDKLAAITVDGIITSQVEKIDASKKYE